MKKYILFTMMMFCLGVSNSFADRHEEDPLNTIYVSDISIAPSGQATLTISMKNSVEIGGFEFDLELPEGITVNHSVNTYGDVVANASLVEERTDASRHTFQTSFIPSNDYSHLKVLCYSSSSKTFLYNDGEVAKIVIDADESIQEGNYIASFKNVVISNATDTYATALVTSNINIESEEIQRTDDFIHLAEGYAVEIIPQSITRGESMLKVYVKAEKGIKNLSFDVELPEGMYFVDEAEWDKTNVKYTYNSNAFTGDPGEKTATLGEGDFPRTMNFKITGAYTTKSKKYITETTNLIELVEFGPIYIATEEDVTENAWYENSTTLPIEGENIIKINKINIVNIEGKEINGEYYTTFIYGNIKNTNPIFYGDYTSSEALNSLKDAIDENTTSIDLTAAIISQKPEVKNPNTLVYVSKDIDGENVIVNKTCKNLVLTDKKSFSAPLKFTANNASYSRTASNAWGTIYLPYAVSSDDNIQYYQLKSTNGNVMTFVPVDGLKAGEPGVFKKKDGNTVSIEEENVTISGANNENQPVDGFTLVGSYDNIAINSAETPGCYIKDNQFKNGVGTFYIDAFRAYFKSNKATSVKAFSIAVEDEVTGVTTIVGELYTKTGDIYSINGSKLQNAKGLYIQNGKKYFAK